jgi:hypothetical protein
VIYVADYIHTKRPAVSQHLLDLALVSRGKRRRALKRKLLEMKPDLVAFSWRNMRSFGPHPEDDTLGVVMNFDYSTRPLQRMKAAKDVLRII